MRVIRSGERVKCGERDREEGEEEGAGSRKRMTACRAIVKVLRADNGILESVCHMIYTWIYSTEWCVPMTSLGSRRASIAEAIQWSHRLPSISFDSVLSLVRVVSPCD